MSIKSINFLVHMHITANLVFSIQCNALY